MPKFSLKCLGLTWEEKEALRKRDEQIVEEALANLKREEDKLHSLYEQQWSDDKWREERDKANRTRRSAIQP